MHVLTSKLWSMAPYGRLRPVDKKFRQREIFAGNRPLGGFLQYGAPAGGFILLTDGSFISHHHNRVLLPPP